jgi:hypothetical protein
VNACSVTVIDMDAIFVDTSAAYFERKNENDNVDAGNHWRMLRRLTQLEGSPCVIVPCHPTKSAGDDNLLPRGGGAAIADSTHGKVRLKLASPCSTPPYATPRWRSNRYWSYRAAQPSRWPASSRRCTGCAREAHHRDDYREGERQRRLKPERREALREYRLNSVVARANRSVAKVRRTKRRKEALALGQRKVSDQGLAYQREYRRTSPKWKQINRVSASIRRVRRRGAVADSSQVRAINRAFARLSREAKRLRMTIDHVVPLAPCRVCGAKGIHVQSNWAMLRMSLNASKGNRCMSCWMAELGRPVIVWMPDLMPSAKSERQLRH